MTTETKETTTEVDNLVTICNANEMYNGIQISFCTLTISFDSTEDYNKSHITDSINIPFDKLGDDIDENEIEKDIISYIKASKGYINRSIFFYSHSIDDIDQYIQKILKIVINKLIPLEQVSKTAKYFKLMNNGYKRFEGRFAFLCRTNKLCTNPFSSTNIDEENKNNDTVIYQPIEIKEYPNEIIEDKLYLGDIHQAYNKTILCNLKITHIINCTHLIRNEFEKDKSMDIKYLKISIADQQGFNISQYFDMTRKFINDAFKNNDDNKVFIHCHAGVSRSSTITIAYLMKQKIWRFNQAFDYVKKARQFIDPNPSFVKQLQQFEKELFNVTNPFNNNNNNASIQQ